MTASLFPRSFLAGFAMGLGLVVLSPASVVAAPKSRNPASKVYIAESNGLVDIDTGGRIHTVEKKAVYNASDAILQTKPGSSSTVVFSNGTGAHLDSDSTLRVDQFVQEPFLPNRTDLDVEPSISKMILTLTHGGVSLCTSRLVAGSSMELNTPHSVIHVRGKRLFVYSDETQTVISLLEGDITVRGGKLDPGGRTLEAGQQAIIRPGLSQEPYEILVQPIPAADVKVLEDKVALACMARRTVYFDENDPDAAGIPFARAGLGVFGSEEDDDIVTVPVVPTIPDPPVFVSPAEIGPPATG